MSWNERIIPFEPFANGLGAKINAYDAAFLLFRGADVHINIIEELSFNPADICEAVSIIFHSLG